MRRILIIAAGLAALPILYATLDAQSATASMTVTATVIKNCTITTSPVNFGAYDPVAANATPPLDGTGTVTVACTKGAVAKVGLNAGSNAQGTTRRMSVGDGVPHLRNLHGCGAHRLGQHRQHGLDIPAAPNKNPRNFTAYGRVASAQDATVGAYTDTVVATVNF